MVLTFVNDKSKHNVWLTDINKLEHIKIEKQMEDYLNEEELVSSEIFFTKRKLYYIKELQERRQKEER
jgi:hypothetical protein